MAVLYISGRGLLRSVRQDIVDIIIRVMHLSDHFAVHMRPIH